MSVSIVYFIILLFRCLCRC